MLDATGLVGDGSTIGILTTGLNISYLETEALLGLSSPDEGAGERPSGRVSGDALMGPLPKIKACNSSRDEAVVEETGDEKSSVGV